VAAHADRARVKFVQTVIRCLPRLTATLSKLMPEVPELPEDRKELAKRVAAGRYNAILNDSKALALYSPAFGGDVEKAASFILARLHELGGE
jgi:hypothetical protein